MHQVTAFSGFGKGTTKGCFELGMHAEDDGSASSAVFLSPTPPDQPGHQRPKGQRDLLELRLAAVCDDHNIKPSRQDLPDGTWNHLTLSEHNPPNPCLPPRSPARWSQTQSRDHRRHTRTPTGARTPGHGS